MEITTSNVYVQQGDGSYVQVQTMKEPEPESGQTHTKPKGVVMSDPLGNEGTPMLDQDKENKSEEFKQEEVKPENPKGIICFVKLHLPYSCTCLI